MFGKGMTSNRARDRLIEKLAREGAASAEVLDVMSTVPRHMFVEEALAHRAYDDGVLPIGFRQTISQPTVVAMMSEAAAAVPNRHRVLEIGTGCGYQTAILACLFDEVYTIERIEALQLRSQQTLSELGYENVSFKFADGHLGWSEHSPFDAIVGTAGAIEVPEDLCEQLVLNGRLVLPVDDPRIGAQALLQLEKVESGFVRKNLCAVRFVPMLSGVESAA